MSGVDDAAEVIAAKRGEMFGAEGALSLPNEVLSRAEWWYAQTFLPSPLDAAEVGRQRELVGTPGIVVGVAPGPRTSAALPMFPHPPGSAGGRLMAMSGMPAEAYLGRLRRANLCRGAFRVDEARGSVRALYWAHRTVDPPHTRLVLCGRRVAGAFSEVLSDGEAEFAWFERGRWAGIEYVAVPHPSGRCRYYNDPTYVARARDAVRWAARYGEGS